MTTVSDCELIEIPVVRDYRGNLGIIENEAIPFKSKRVFYLYDVPSEAVRGGHAHKKLQQFLIPLSGSFDVIIDDSYHKKTVTLNRPNIGLHIVPGIWDNLQNFSSGCVCLVLASEEYDESDYIRDYQQFVNYKQK